MTRDIYNVDGTMRSTAAPTPWVDFPVDPGDSVGVLVCQEESFIVHSETVKKLRFQKENNFIFFIIRSNHSVLV